MDTSVPRLRMFAGPNGSGKSTINKVVRPEILGTYINPDDLARSLVSSAGLDFSQFEIDLSLDSIRDFFNRSDFLRLTGTTELASGLEASGDRLFYAAENRVGYLASALSDYLRRELLLACRSFAFETVMSAADKVDLLREAQQRGFARTCISSPRKILRSTSRGWRPEFVKAGMTYRRTKLSLATTAVWNCWRKPPTTRTGRTTSTIPPTVASACG